MKQWLGRPSALSAAFRSAFSRFGGRALKPIFAPLITTLRDTFSGTDAEAAIRASTATVEVYNAPNAPILRTAQINEARRVGMRRVENLLSFAEDFSNAAWAKSFVTAGALVADPFGGSSASTYYETSDTNQHGIIRQITTAPSANVSFSVYIKPGDRRYIALRFFRGVNNWVTAVFDTLTGAVTQSSAGSGNSITGFTQSYEIAENGFIRLMISCTNFANNDYVSWTHCTSATPTLSAAGGTELYTGDITKSSVYFGAQLENVTGQTVTTAGDYVSTTTAARAAYFPTDPSGNPLNPTKDMSGATWTRSIADWVPATYAVDEECNYLGYWYKASAAGTDTTFNSSGIWSQQGLYSRKYGLLVEESRTNLCVHSGAIATANGYGIAASATLTSNASAAPDGTVTASLYTSTANISGPWWSPVLSYTAATNYTHSLYVKKGTAQWMTLQLWSGSGIAGVQAWFDLTNGVKGSSAATAGWVYTNHGIEDTGNGWYRLWVTGKFTAGGNTYLAMWHVGGDAAHDFTAIAGLTSYIWGAQQEQAATPSTYIPTTTAAVTRSEEMGNIKWDSTATGFNFPQAKGSMFLTWVPQYDSAATTAAMSIVSLNDGFYPLYQNTAAAQLRVYDGTTAFNASLTSWSNGDAIELCLQWDDSIPEMRLSYRKISDGGAWVHGAAAAYDGGFISTGFMQLLTAGVSNNDSIFRNLPVVFDQVFTATEIEEMTA